MKVLQGVQGKGPEQGEEAPAVLGPLFSPLFCAPGFLPGPSLDSLEIPQGLIRPFKGPYKGWPKESFGIPQGIPEEFPRHSLGIPLGPLKGPFKRPYKAL